MSRHGLQISTDPQISTDLQPGTDFNRLTELQTGFTNYIENVGEKMKTFSINWLFEFEVFYNFPGSYRLHCRP